MKVVRLTAALLFAVCVSCSGGSDESADESRPAAAATTTQPPPITVLPEGSPLTIYATSELHVPLLRLLVPFRNAFPDFDVDLVVLPSEELRARIDAGNLPDIYIDSAEAMSSIDQSELIGDGPIPFGKNVMLISTRRQNPLRVDLRAFGFDPATVSAVCAPETVCGELGEQVLRSADIASRVDRVEPDGKTIVELVKSGEVDAGLVLRTDARTRLFATSVVRVPDEHERSVEYSLGRFSRRTESVGFVRYLLEADIAKQILGVVGLADLEPPPTTTSLPAEG